MTVKQEPGRAMHLLPEQARIGFSTCCPAPPIYALMITFEKRDHHDELKLRTQVRRLCAKHGKNYASKFQLQLPALDAGTP